MRQKIFAALIIFSTICLNREAVAQVSECDAALIRSTYQLNEDRFRDYRLATSVTESQYNELRRNASANAVIYGVPMGANFSEFEQNRQSSASTRDERLTEHMFRNLLIVGVDPRTPNLYAECLRSIRSRRFSATIDRATDTEITIVLSYNPIGIDPREIPVTFQTSAAPLVGIPSTILPGETPIVFHRPDRESVVAINIPGLPAVLTLTPLPATLPPPPQGVFLCEFINATAVREGLQAGSTANWTCPERMAAGRYELTVDLSGSTSTSPSNVGRVTYGITFVPPTGPSVEFGPLPRADFNWTPGCGGCNPPNFRLNPTVIERELPAGNMSVTLRIAGIADHHNFGNNNNGTTSVTGGTVRLRRLQ